MKRSCLMIAAMIALAVSAYAQMDVYDTVTVKTLSVPTLVTGTTSNSVVDVAAAKGNCNVLFFLGAATTNATDYTCTATLKHSATSGGAYITVTNGAGSAVVATTTNCAGVGAISSVKVEAEQLKRYVRLYVTTANDSGEVGAVLLYKK